MAIKVYADAASNLFKSFLEKKKLDIKVFPIELSYEGKSYLCYSEDIDVPTMSKEFYQDMREGMKPRTSLVNPQIILDAMEEEVAKGNEIVYVTLSSGISGTYQTATLFANEINEKYGRKYIHIVDSRTAGFGEGLIAMHVAKLVKEGKTFTEVCGNTEAYVSKVRSEFTVDDLKYLAQTGRISKLAAKIANVLSIKPLLYGSDAGKIEVTSKEHGRLKALKTLASQVCSHIRNPQDQTVYISHCDSEGDANKLKDMLLNKGIKNVEVYFYDLVTGSHVGPGTIAVFYEGELRTI